MPDSHRFWFGFLLLLSNMAAVAAPAGCDAFTWNMRHELALFAAPPAAAGTRSPIAGRSIANAPKVRVDRLYSVALAPQDSVEFAHAPGRHATGDMAYGGILRIAVAEDGNYRISLDQAVWVDIVHGTELITSNAFQGGHDCSLIHKSVEFTLPAHQVLVLQLTGGRAASVKLAITRAAV